MVGRCRATKRCTYCGKLAAVENAEMVALDACESAPTLFVVLTTVDPFVTRETVRRDLEQTWKAVRGCWPAAEYACFVEFTTGLSVWSGGHRRVHLNLLVKGVSPEQADDLRAALVGSWCRRTRTSQLHVGEVYAAEGLVRYVTNLALHVMKEGQKPPTSYAGHLVRWTRGYFAEGATAMRARARRSLKVKRRIYAGLDAQTAEFEVAAAEHDEWELRTITLAPLDFARQIRLARSIALLFPMEGVMPGDPSDRPSAGRACGLSAGLPAGSVGSRPARAP